MKKIIIAV